MSYSHFYALLSNPYYTGTIRLVSGESYKGPHPPMVTHEEFTRVQELLGRVIKPRKQRLEFAYSGLLACAECGRTLVAEQHIKPSGARYVYYRCHRQRADARCAQPTLPEQAFEAQLAADLDRVRLPEGIAAWVRRMLEQSLIQELAQRGISRESGESALRDSKAEADNLLTLRLRGLVDDDTFVERRNEILTRQEAIQEQLARPQASPGELLARFDRVLEFSRQATEMLRNGTPVQRRQIVQTIGSNWQVRDRFALYSTKKPFTALAGTATSPGWWTIVDDVRTWLLESQPCSVPDLTLARYARPA